MLKTIKTTKQLKLDELLNYIFEEKIKGEGDYGIINFHSDADTDVEVNSCGQVSVHGLYSGNELFPVEIEEEITEDTEFSGVQEVYLDIEEQKIRVEIYFGKTTIEEVLNNNDDNTKCLQIYALINGKRELIWEREKK